MNKIVTNSFSGHMKFFSDTVTKYVRIAGRNDLIFNKKKYHSNVYCTLVQV